MVRINYNLSFWIGLLVGWTLVVMVHGVSAFSMGHDVQSSITIINRPSTTTSFLGASSKNHNTHFNSASSSSSIMPFRILTWNVLAQCYIKRPPPFLVGAFSTTAENDHDADDTAAVAWPAYTDWTYRQTKFVEILEQSQADIVCLQEVERSQLDSWTALCNGLGYQECHVQETNDDQHPVTNVILLRNTTTKNNSTDDTRHHNQWKVVWKESRSRALILGIQQQQLQPPTTGTENEPNEKMTTTSASFFFLVNLHLQASSAFDHIQTAQTRYSQIQSLLKRIKAAWNKLEVTIPNNDDINNNSNNNPQPQESSPTIIMTGDFNFSPSEPLYKLLVRGEWPSDDDEGEEETSNNGSDSDSDTNANEAERIAAVTRKTPKPKYKHLLPSKVSELSASSLPFLPLRDAVQEQQQQQQPQPTMDQPETDSIVADPSSSSLLSPNSQPLFSHFGWTYAPSQRLYDYIFVSNQVETMELYHSLPPSLLDSSSSHFASPVVSYSAAVAAQKNGSRTSSTSLSSSSSSSSSASNQPFLYWPNKYYPSDHIAIGATLQIHNTRQSVEQFKQS